MGRLDGKVAVVLGAASEGNMGQVIARRFAKEGAKVVVAGRHEAPLARLAEEIGGAHALCDITKKPEIEALKDKAVSTFGGCHIAVNGTGWAMLGPALETKAEDLEKLTAIQFTGVYFFLQVFGGHMSQNGGGSIIQITSASTTCIIDNHAAYIGTKAGGDHLVMAFASELGPHGVKVNSVCPGLTEETPMASAPLAMPGLREAFLNKYPLGRLGTCDDVADASVWLAEDTSFMTGQILQVNGGLTLRGNPTYAEIAASAAAAQASQAGML